MKRKRIIVITTCTAAVMVLAACGKNPDSSIVKNKDFDKMIEKAKDSEGEVKDVAPDYDTYKSSLSDESLKVTVKADAKVDIPNTDKMSIIRMKQKSISQDFLNRAIDTFTDGEKLYDGSITEVRTRKEIEEEIRSIKQSLEHIDEAEVPEEELRHRLDSCQEEYENSPDNVDWSKYESDNLLHSVEEMSARMNNTFYKWEKDLNPAGEVFYGINRGDKGEFIALYAQNCEDYGNCIRFAKSRHGYIWNMQVAGTLAVAPLSDAMPRDDATVWKAGSDIPKRRNSMLGGDVTEYEDEAVTISEDEAKKKADKCIADMGIEDFEVYGSGLYSEVQEFRNNPDGDSEEPGYCTYYLFRYVRKVDGAFVTLEGDEKYTAEWVNDSFVKKIWPKEYIDIKVNDNGIIEFIYSGPLEKVETVVDKSNMLSFDEIKGTFEKMVIAVNAQSEWEEETEIDIDRVTLGYALISEKDRFDTGLLVPVWNFIGTKTMKSGGEVRDKYSGSVLTINAIDGTVIDGKLGY